MGLERIIALLVTLASLLTCLFILFMWLKDATYRISSWVYERRKQNV